MSKGIVFRNHQNEKIYPCAYYPVGSIFLSINNCAARGGNTNISIKSKCVHTHTPIIAIIAYVKIT